MQNCCRETDQQRDPANELVHHLDRPFDGWPREPDGYNIYRAADRNFSWELIEDPINHRGDGFATFDECLQHCREACCRATKEKQGTPQ